MVRKTKQWCHATIVELDKRPEADRAMPIHKVGFRVYDKEGDRKDEMGSYFTTSDADDDLIGGYTVRIQPKGTMCQMKDLTGKAIASLIENKVIVKDGVVSKNV